MKRISTLLVIFAVGLLGGLGGSYLFSFFEEKENGFQFQYPQPPARMANYGTNNAAFDFRQAAEVSSPCVVFIKTVSNVRQPRQNDFWDMWDFWGRRGPVSSAGSGVIISPEGHIVTNNHVIDKADIIEVVLNNKHSYKAKVIGADPNTDLALIKIEAKNLKAIKIGNSDDVKIGEWVVAIGNPMNLNSTVTAGIVSAKGRNINVVNTAFPIESFIQTDAAINPGNSGGALVNTRGELIGVNTAIASQTGAYSGYGFAIPSRMVEKIIKDLADFGSVQRAYLGAEVEDIDETYADKLPDGDYSGVYVVEVEKETAAAAAGIKTGDVILKINGFDVNAKSEFMERLSLTRPGDAVTLMIKRGGKPMELSAKMTNAEGTTEMLKSKAQFVEALGCNVAPLSKMEKQRLGVTGGYRLSSIRGGKIKQLGLPEDFVVLSVNRKTPQDIDELAKWIAQTRGQLIIEGLNPNGSKGVYSFYSY